MARTSSALLFVITSLLCAPAARAAALLPSPLPRSQTPAPTTVVVDLRKERPEWQMVALSVQGLVNRTHPQVYCIQTEMDGFWLNHTRERGWIKGWKNVSSPRALLDRYRSSVRGAVLTDPAFPASINIAVMLASVDNGVVASPSVAQTLNLPILHDLRGRWKTNAEAYQWAYDRLWPRLSHRVLSVSHPSNTMPRDYQIQNRVFTFWITGPVDGRNPGASPAEETRLMERLFARMPVNIPILGYPYAGEGIGIQETPGVTLFSRYGKYLIPTDISPNLSFHSGVRPPRLRQPSPPAPKLDRGKVYLSFIVSDGDNLQVHTNTSFPNLWKDPRRGTFPIGWSMSPSAATLIPNVVDWYYRNATPNDAFVAAVSGVGYMYPDEYAARLPAATRARVFDGFLAQTASEMRAIDHRTIWIMRGTLPSTLERYARKIPELAAVFPDYGRQVTSYESATFPTARTVPVFRATTSWGGETPEERTRTAVEQIRAMAPESGPGFLHVFILNWTADLGAMENVLKQLGPRYVAVRPDHLGALYSEHLRSRRVDIRMPGQFTALEEMPINVPISLLNATPSALTVRLSAPGLSLPRSVRLAPGEPVNLNATGRPRAGRLTLTATEPKGTHRVSANVRIVPDAEIVGAKPAGNLRFVRHYEAEGMSHAYGARVADKAAGNGAAWSSGTPAGGAGNRHILFGPYESFAPGRYVALFRLKRTVPMSGAAATLDITVSGGREPLAVRSVSAIELPDGRYRSVVVPFRYTRGDVETRVRQAGPAAIVVDSVTLFRVS